MKNKKIDKKVDRILTALMVAIFVIILIFTYRGAIYAFDKEYEMRSRYIQEYNSNAEKQQIENKL